MLDVDISRLDHILLSLFYHIIYFLSVGKKVTQINKLLFLFKGNKERTAARIKCGLEPNANRE